MNSAYVLGIGYTLAGVGLVVLTGYLFAVGERVPTRAKRNLSALIGIILALGGTVGAFKGLWIAVSGAPVLIDGPLGGVVMVAWAMAWFAIIVVFTYKPDERLWGNWLDTLE